MGENTVPSAEGTKLLRAETTSDGASSLLSDHGDTATMNQPATGSAKPSSPAFESRETILLVDDEESVRELVRETLTSQGYKVLEGENGEAGLRLAENYSGQIDMLITDVVMPGIGGRDLARKLIELRPAMNVLYFSGYTEDTVFNDEACGPRHAFLQKPFAMQDLARKVREILHPRTNAVSAGE